MDRCQVVVCAGNSCPGVYCPSGAAAKVAAGPETDRLSGGLSRSVR